MLPERRNLRGRLQTRSVSLGRGRPPTGSARRAIALSRLRQSRTLAYLGLDQCCESALGTKCNVIYFFWGGGEECYKGVEVSGRLPCLFLGGGGRCVLSPFISEISEIRKFIDVVFPSGGQWGGASHSLALICGAIGSRTPAPRRWSKSATCAIFFADNLLGGCGLVCWVGRGEGAFWWLVP